MLFLEQYQVQSVINLSMILKGNWNKIYKGSKRTVEVWSHFTYSQTEYFYLLHSLEDSKIS